MLTGRLEGGCMHSKVCLKWFQYGWWGVLYLELIHKHNTHASMVKDSRVKQGPLFE